MTGLVRKATLLVVCGLLAMTATALAGIPSPGNSDKPSYIDVVGTVSVLATSGAPVPGAGVPDSRGTFTIVVRDLGNNAIGNCQVVLDFGACTDMTLCYSPALLITGESYQYPYDTTQVIDCPSYTLRGYTDVLGSVTFSVVGLAFNTGVHPGPGANCINILAAGVSLGRATCAVYDQNGAVTTNGVEVTDMVGILKDWGSGIYFGRSDLDHDGFLTVLDLVPFRKCYGDGTSSNGCGYTYCTGNGHS
jgi:hypothetical protein